MKSVTFPLAMPEDLYGQVKRTAEKTRLSMADALCESIALGLPALEQKLSASELKPLTKEEARLGYEVPNEEFDALEHHCAKLLVRRQVENDSEGQ